MKAMICTTYGAPDVLQLKDLDRPAPGAKDVLIRVRAAVVGPSDCAFRKGDPFIVKLLYGLSRPRLKVFGVEFAGEVEAVGAAVTQFRPGDQVFGMSPSRFGAHAEYLCLPEDKPLIVKPAATTYEDIVAICDGLPTALTFLKDKARLQPGQSILINGASGAVGAYAVQLARHIGARVTGVCSGANRDLVQSLGADAVIDYTREDFTAGGQTYDVVFDAVGKSSFGRCKGILAPRGVYLSTAPSLGIVVQMLRTKLFGRRKAIFATAGLMQTKASLGLLTELIESGAIQPVIDRSYPLEQIAAAHHYVDQGHKKGNVVITL